MYITGKKNKKQAVGKDERDMLIQGKVGIRGLVIVLAYVYLFCIIIYVIYRDVNSVPAGWLWFLAYSSMFVGWISASIVSLIYYYKGLNGNER